MKKIYIYPRCKHRGIAQVKTHEPIVKGNNIPPILWAASKSSEGVSHKYSLTSK
jgi:hypothetical protein